MGRLKLSVANAGDYFSAGDVQLFERAAKDAEQFTSSLFEFDYDVDVILTSPSYLMPTIAEDGIGGRTYNSRLIILTLNKEQAPIREDAVFETICHELAHSVRWEKVADRADTLLKTMIFEGLAVVLEETAMEQTNRQSTQFFLTEMQRTDSQTIDAIDASLKRQFTNVEYDYETIFYSGNESLPRWAGYRLGYNLVKTYLASTGASIQEVTLTDYDEIAHRAT